MSVSSWRTCAQHELVETVLKAFKSQAGGQPGPRFVLIEAPPGYGKTRVIQDVYSRLIESNHDRYWPPWPQDDPDQNVRDILRYRKLISQPQADVRLTDLPSFAWWAINASHVAGSSAAAMPRILKAEVESNLAPLLLSRLSRETLPERSREEISRVWALIKQDFAENGPLDAAAYAAERLGVAEPLVALMASLVRIAASWVRGHYAIGAQLARDEKEEFLQEEAAWGLIRRTVSARFRGILVIDDAHEMPKTLERLLTLALDDHETQGLTIVTAGRPGSVGSPWYNRLLMRVAGDPRVSKYRLALPDAEDRRRLAQSISPKLPPQSAAYFGEVCQDLLELRLLISSWRNAQGSPDSAQRVAVETRRHILSEYWQSLPTKLQIVLGLLQAVVEDRPAGDIELSVLNQALTLQGQCEVRYGWLSPEWSSRALAQLGGELEWIYVGTERMVRFSDEIQASVVRDLRSQVLSEADRTEFVLRVNDVRKSVVLSANQARAASPPDVVAAARAVIESVRAEHEPGSHIETLKVALDIVRDDYVDAGMARRAFNELKAWLDWFRENGDEGDFFWLANALVLCGHAGGKAEELVAILEAGVQGSGIHDRWVKVWLSKTYRLAGMKDESLQLSRSLAESCLVDFTLDSASDCLVVIDNLACLGAGLEAIALGNAVLARLPGAEASSSRVSSEISYRIGGQWVRLLNTAEREVWQCAVRAAIGRAHAGRGEWDLARRQYERTLSLWAATPRCAIPLEEVMFGYALALAHMGDQRAVEICRHYLAVAHPPPGSFGEMEFFDAVRVTSGVYRALGMLKLSREVLAYGSLHLASEFANRLSGLIQFDRMEWPGL